MKRVFGILLSLVFMFTFACFFVEVKADTNMVEVEVAFFYDEDNIVKPAEPPQYAYGSNISYEAVPNPGYEFAFWIVNGIVRPELPASSTFTVSTNTTLMAVFHPVGKRAVLFIDTNGKYIDIQFVDDGDNAVDPELNGKNLPDKPGMTPKTLEQLRWKTQTGETSLTNITDNKVFVLQYQVENTDVYTLTVDGVEVGDYVYNEIAVAETPAEKDGVPFAYWEEDGHRVSYDPTYAFTMLKDRNLTPVYAEGIAKMPLVALTGIFEDLRENYYTFLGQVYLPTEGYSLVEAGFLLSDEMSVLKKNGGNVETVPVPKLNATTTEFLMSIPKDSFGTSTRAYLVVKDSEGKLLTVHSNNQQSYTLAGGASDLIISEYIEGSSNNKAIEIYNGTGSAVDLSKYEIELYNNGNTTKNSTLPLSGLLAAGDTYVIVNNQAASGIKDKADITHGGVASFNGDDAVVLCKDGERIDIFGIVGVVEKWGENKTLVRKPNVYDPTTAFDLDEWIEYPQDTFDYLGNHDMDTSGLSGEFNNVAINSYPVISGAEDATIIEGQSFDLLNGVIATDDTDGECKIIVEVLDENDDEVTDYGDFSSCPAGIYEITYSVTNSLSNTTVRKITLTIANPAEPVVMYSTGFESSEGFTAGQDYNKPEESNGPTNKQWLFYYGTPSTTDKISGDQSAQMRWYTSAKTNFGYAAMDFDLYSVTKIEFRAKNTTGINVKLFISTDNGSSWELLELFVLTTSAKLYSHNLVGYENQNVRFKFELTFSNEPSKTSRLYIDDVSIWGYGNPQ